MTAKLLAIVARMALLVAGACAFAASLPSMQYTGLAVVAGIGLLIVVLWQPGSTLESDTGRAAMGAGMCLLVWPAMAPLAATPLRIVIGTLLLVALLSTLMVRRRSGLDAYALAAIVVSIGICTLAVVMFLALRTRYNLDPALLRETVVQTITFGVAFLTATLAFVPHDGIVLVILLFVRAALSWRGLS